MKKVALVTGGTRGIGLGIARCLAGDGFDLAVNGVREEEAATASLAELRAMGADVLYCRGDISDGAARRQVLDRVRQHFGRLDLLVNNAGVAPKERADILDASEESFDWLIAVNLKGPYFLTQAAAGWMIEQKQADPSFSGAIVYVTSISSDTASINRGDYCLSKAGLSMAASLWAVRLGEHGIPVYEVRPGIIHTDMTAGVTGKYDKLIDEGLLVQSRWGTPEDVGKAVAMLARGDLPYSTGQVLNVDGGFGISRL